MAQSKDEPDQQTSHSNVIDNKKEIPKDHAPSKVVIRRLPPTLTPEDFLEQVSPLPDYDFFYFVRADMSLGQNAFTRAYINFLTPDDIFIFRDRFDGYVFLDAKGGEYPAIVEFAPFQKVPKKKSKKLDTKIGLIEQDSDYKKFLDSLSKPAEASPVSLDAMVAEVETKENNIAKFGSAKVTTPLLEYLRKRREERKLNIAKLKEERRRGGGGGRDRDMDRKRSGKDELDKRKLASSKDGLRDRDRRRDRVRYRERDRRRDRDLMRSEKSKDLKSGEKRWRKETEMAPRHTVMLLRNTDRESHGSEKRESYGSEKRESHGSEKRESHTSEKRESHGSEKRESHSSEKRESHSSEKRESHSSEKRESHSSEKRERHGSEIRESHSSEKRESSENSMSGKGPAAEWEKKEEVKERDIAQESLSENEQGRGGGNEQKRDERRGKREGRWGEIVGREDDRSHHYGGKERGHAIEEDRNRDKLLREKGGRGYREDEGLRRNRYTEEKGGGDKYSRGGAARGRGDRSGGGGGVRDKYDGGGSERRAGASGDGWRKKETDVDKKRSDKERGQDRHQETGRSRGKDDDKKEHEELLTSMSEDGRDETDKQKEEEKSGRSVDPLEARPSKCKDETNSYKQTADILEPAGSTTRQEKEENEEMGGSADGDNRKRKRKDRPERQIYIPRKALERTKQSSPQMGKGSEDKAQEPS